MGAVRNENRLKKGVRSDTLNCLQHKAGRANNARIKAFLPGG